MKKGMLLILIVIINILADAMPGRLLVIGGGSERSQPDTWNALPYQWAVNQSVNKKVAVIDFGAAPDTWLTDYFVNNCGAVKAVFFDISSVAVADSQATYDSLMLYDVIFFKGGNQANYYNSYRNTKTQQAVEEIFNRGGVICGTSAGAAILSGVVYTAVNGSVYPDEAIQNPFDNDMTLANDFFQFMPGYVFDTHFAERGRLARLIGMVANWKLTHGETITGMGVDDLTAIAIDTNLIGTVYGTGTINIIKSYGVNSFSTSNNELLADSVKIISLLHGCTYNFITGEYEGWTETYTPPLMGETGNYTVIASGSDVANLNYNTLRHLRDSVGNVSDAILIITGSNTTLATSLKTYLENNSITTAEIIQVSSTNANDNSIAAKISNSHKILIAGNTFSVFKTFLSGTAGQTLIRKVKSNDMITAFIGDNSRFAGAKVIEKYNVAGAAYDAELQFFDGMALLSQSCIMPNTYLNSDIYENTVTGQPYAMMKFGIRYGFWLTSRNYMVYSPENEKTYIKTYGTAPLMIAIHEATQGGFSTHTSSGSTSVSPRMLAGYDHFELKLIDETCPFQSGDSVHVSVSRPLCDASGDDIKIYQSDNQIIIEPGFIQYRCFIFSTDGKLTDVYQTTNGKICIPSDYLPEQLFIVNCKDVTGTLNKTCKVLLSR